MQGHANNESKGIFHTLKFKLNTYYQFYRVKFVIQYANYLLWWNNIPTDNTTAMHFMLGELTDDAFSHKEKNQKNFGQAEKSLYWVDRELNLFFFKIPIKIRGLSLFSIVNGNKKKTDFTDLPDRTTFAVPSAAMRDMIFPALPWSKVNVSQVRHNIKNTFIHRQSQLWSETKAACRDFKKTANPFKSPAFNYAMMTFNIFSKMLGNGLINDQLLAWLDKFEDSWLGFETARFDDLEQSLYDFTELLKNTNQADEKTHRDFLSLLPILGNMPRLMVQFCYQVLANDNHFNTLQKEINRLQQLLLDKNLDLNNKDPKIVNEAMTFLLNHSEVLERYYFECLRVAPVVPVMFRINTNIFSNGNENWSLGANQSLPPRSMAILPQMRIAMHPDNYNNPTQFNPMRAEYKFDTRKNGSIYSTDEPLSFAPASLRMCPGRNFMRKLFYVMAFNSIQYDLKVTLEERDHKAATRVMDYRKEHYAKLDQCPGLTTQFMGSHLKHTNCEPSHRGNKVASPCL